MLWGEKKGTWSSIRYEQWVNTISISVHGNNKIISQFLPCCQPKVPSDLVRGGGNLQSVWSCWCSWGLDKPGWCHSAAQWSRVQIPEAAPTWISIGTCWAAGSVREHQNGFLLCCTCIVKSVENSLTEHTGLSAPRVVSGSLATVGELVSWKSAPHTHQLALAAAAAC